MVENEMVKRVRDAMLRVNEETKGLYYRDLIEAMARAAIEAMMTPTEAMVEAGFERLDYDEWGASGEADAFNRRVCARVFTAMVSRALTEPKEGAGT